MRFATAARFGPPQPVPPGDAAPLSAAPQPPNRLERVTGPTPSLPQDEDCLFLNVWAPKGAAGLPVLVFLHGGGFSSGSGGLPWYDGARLAERGRMVVVTVNYRLGALGFADAPMLAGAAPQELARLVDDVQHRWISFVHG
jgi:para-nitrobenzyl esterase